MYDLKIKLQLQTVQHLFFSRFKFVNSIFVVCCDSLYDAECGDCAWPKVTANSLGLVVIKLFFMLNSAEHGILTAHKY